MGTVGKYSASPINIADHMRENIPLADFVVIVATPRYLQLDLHKNEITNGLSEMVHVEAGMAFALKKPVIVFVKEGTHVGNFLPNITQYIILNGEVSDVKAKWTLIHKLIDNARKIVRNVKDGEIAETVFGVGVAGLALYGAVHATKSVMKSMKSKKKKGGSPFRK